MTTIVDGREFAQAVKTAARAVQQVHRKPNLRYLPILNNVLIRRTGRHVEVLGTDLETVEGAAVPAFAQDLPGAPENWEITVPACALRDYLAVCQFPARKITPVELRPNLREVKLVIRQPNMTACFLGIDAAEFPVVQLKPA